MEYAPYAILNYTVPIISIIFGYIGFKIIKLDDDNDGKSLSNTKKTELV